MDKLIITAAICGAEVTKEQTESQKEKLARFGIERQ
jgi:hypothetical protein